MSNVLLSDPRHPAFPLQEHFIFHELLIQPEQDSGGYGQVYKVQHREEGHYLALKIVKPDLDESGHKLALDMLRREARILRQVRHPNIVQLVKDCSDAHAVPHLLLEYVPGVSLEHYVASPGPDSYCRLRLAIGICSAVMALESEQWQHNDLHPLNVVVDELAQWPVLIDFGLATQGGKTPPDILGLGRENWVHPQVVGGKTPFTQETESYQLRKIIQHVLGQDALDIIYAQSDDTADLFDQDIEILSAEALRDALTLHLMRELYATIPS